MHAIMRTWFSGKIAAFQAAVAGSIPAVRTKMNVPYMKRMLPKTKRTVVMLGVLLLTGFAVTSTEELQAEVINNKSSATSTAAWVVQSLRSPYKTPPRPFEEVNQATRAALVNIYCSSSKGAGPITASGVIIDPRGIILTSAHVAQYLLLQYSPVTSPDIRCVIRTGNPAREAFLADVLYFPPLWIEEHANEIRMSHPTGTGEHDWALLQITRSADDRPSPKSFPYLIPDTRELIAFTNEYVLLASYPAGFLGFYAVSWNLYPASTIVSIGQLYTFSTGSVDALSLGGNIVAQAGSSGGPATNQWGRLIGIITTSSEAEITSERELRAVTLSHVDRSMSTQTGKSLYTFLTDDIETLGKNFRNETAPSLAKELVRYLVR